MTWEPEKALKIYAEVDKLKPFLPLREMGSYIIVKAQAYTYNGDVDRGIELAIKGIGLAKKYGSQHHISRIRGMYDRLQVTPLGRHRRMNDLKEALADIQL